MSAQPEISSPVSAARVPVLHEDVVEELVTFCNARIARGARDAWIAVADRLVERLWNGDLDAALAPSAEAHLPWRALIGHPGIRLDRAQLSRCRGLLRLRQQLPATAFRALSVTHLFALLPLPDADTRRALAEQAVVERWNVAVLRRAVAGLLGVQAPPPGLTLARRTIRAVERVDLSSILALPPYQARLELLALDSALEGLRQALGRALVTLEA
jgi:hypothetical protein